MRHTTEDEVTEKSGGLRISEAAMAEATRTIERRKVDRSGPRDARICVCGHPASGHRYFEVRGTWQCRIPSFPCPCASLEAVAEVSDTRVFKFKTSGKGEAEHALTLGIAKAIGKGIRVEFVGDALVGKCKACGESGREVSPRAVSFTAGKIIGESSRDNGLLCASCVEKLS